MVRNNLLVAKFHNPASAVSLGLLAFGVGMVILASGLDLLITMRKIRKGSMRDTAQLLINQCAVGYRAGSFFDKLVGADQIVSIMA